MQFKLEYSYAGQSEHCLIYTTEYNGFEIVKEIATKKKYGKFSNEKVIYYCSTLKPVFDTLNELLIFLQNVRCLK